MRILILTNLYPNPLQPDRAPWNRQEVAALAERNPVRVIAPIAWTDEWSLRRQSGSRLPSSRASRNGKVEAVHPRHLFVPRVWWGQRGRFYRESVRRSFIHAVRDFQPDLVYATWAYPDGWAAVELGHAAGLPVAVKVVGSDLLALPAAGGRRLRTAETLRKADLIVAVSRQLADEAAHLGACPERIRVVRTGVDTSRFFPGTRRDARQRLGLDFDGPQMLFVGNLAPVKQVDVLIAACALLARSGVDFRCHIVGEGPLRAALAAQVEQEALSERVLLHGGRPHEEIPDWIRSADTVVLPSRSEGVPNVLLEANACGVPFVASRVGGIPEIAGPASRLVLPGDVRELAAALGQTLSADLKESLPVSAWTWRDSANELASLFSGMATPGAINKSPGST